MAAIGTSTSIGPIDVNIGDSSEMRRYTSIATRHDLDASLLESGSPVTRSTFQNMLDSIRGAERSIESAQRDISSAEGGRAIFGTLHAGIAGAITGVATGGFAIARTSNPVLIVGAGLAGAAAGFMGVRSLVHLSMNHDIKAAEGRAATAQANLESRVDATRAWIIENGTAPSLAVTGGSGMSRNAPRAVAA